MRSHHDAISELKMALRWSQPAARPEERRERPCGGVGNGRGTDAGGCDAAEEDIGPIVVLRGLARYVNYIVASSTLGPKNRRHGPIGKFVLILWIGVVGW